MMNRPSSAPRIYQNTHTLVSHNVGDSAKGRSLQAPWTIADPSLNGSGQGSHTSRLGGLAAQAVGHLAVEGRLLFPLISYPPTLWEASAMSHTVRGKAKLVSRVRRIRGQVEALDRALETEAGCAQTLQLIASVRGAINSLTAEIMEDHIRVHVVDPERERNSDRADAADELIDVVRAYFK